MLSVHLFTTPWTAAYQAPPSMGFSRQEYWSGSPVPSLILKSRDIVLHYIHCCIKKQLILLSYKKNAFESVLMRWMNLEPIIREGNGTPLQYSCLENPMDRGAWGAAVHGVMKSQIRLSDFPSLVTFLLWRRKWQRTPVFLPGESQGWWSLVGCRLWSRTESDTTEAT